MRIAFDHQIFWLQSYGGVSRYFVRLAGALAGGGDEVSVHAPLHSNRYLRELPDGVVRGLELPRYPPRSGWLMTRFNRAAARASIRRARPDLVHETYFSERTVAPRGCATIVTVYDMIHELFDVDDRVWHETRAAKRAAVARAAHVLCISENTRSDLVRLLGTPEEKTSVVHLGVDPLPAAAAANEGGHPPRPYLLYVGARSRYKNFHGLVAAMASSGRLRSDFDLVAFGGGPLTRAEQAMISDAGLSPERVRQVEGGDGVLGALYAGARAFVYPSLYEGFGLPPLEAMAQGCPVVSSGTSSMPEVIGDAAEFFDPSSVDDVRRAIEAVAYSKARRAELVERGRARVKRFSWQECAERTAAVYRRVIA